MKKYLGKGVYGAVAIGKISVFKKCDAAVTRIHVEDTEKEKQRVKAAKELAAKQLTEIHEKALREVGETHAQTIDFSSAVVLSVFAPVRFAIMRLEISLTSAALACI